MLSQSKPKTPLDEVAQSIALAGSFKNPNSPDKRALQFPYPIPRSLPILSESQKRQRPDILPFSTSISSEREAREQAALEEDERRLREEEHEAFLASMRAKDDAERALLKVRNEMITTLEAFDFSESSSWKLSTQIASYFRTLSHKKKDLFIQSVKRRFMANLDHIILHYEKSQANSREMGAFAPDVIATRLSTALLLDSKKKGAKLNIPNLCELVLKSQMIELNLLEPEEESELSSEPQSRIEYLRKMRSEQLKKSRQQNTHSEMNKIGDKKEEEEEKKNEENHLMESSFVSISNLDNTLNDTKEELQRSVSIDIQNRSESRNESRDTSSAFWAMKRGGGLVTDAVGNVKHGETMNMLTNVWLAERGVITTATDAREMLAQSLDLNELRMTDTAAADYVDTLLIGDEAGRNQKAFLKGAYALSHSNKWMHAPIDQGEGHGDGNKGIIRANTISDSLGGYLDTSEIKESNNQVPIQSTLRRALGSTVKDSPASIATLSSKATRSSLHAMLQRRHTQAESALIAIETKIKAKEATKRNSAYLSIYNNSNKTSLIEKETPLSSEERGLLAASENVKASQTTFDFRAIASTSTNYDKEGQEGHTLPLGGVRLGVTEIAPSLTSRVILQRRNVVVVSQDNTPSVIDSLAGRRTQTEMSLLYKGGRVEAIHRLPILAQPEPLLVETSDDINPLDKSSYHLLEGTDFSNFTTQRKVASLTRKNLNVSAPIYQHKLITESLQRALDPRSSVDSEDIHIRSRKGFPERPKTPEGSENNKREKKKITGMTDTTSTTKWYHKHGYSPGASIVQGHNTSIAALEGPYAARRLLIDQGIRDSGELVMLKMGALQSMQNATSSISSSGTDTDTLSMSSSFEPSQSITSGDKSNGMYTNTHTDSLVQSLRDSQSLPLSAGTRNRVLGRIAATKPLGKMKVTIGGESETATKQVSLKKGLYLI